MQDDINDFGRTAIPPGELEMRERPKVAGRYRDCERHDADCEDCKHKPIHDAGAGRRAAHDVAALMIGGRPRNERVDGFPLPGHGFATPPLPSRREYIGHLPNAVAFTTGRLRPCRLAARSLHDVLTRLLER